MKKGFIIAFACAVIAFSALFVSFNVDGQVAFANNGMLWSEYAEELVDDWGEGAFTISSEEQFAGMYNFVFSNKSNYVFTISSKLDLSAHIWEPLTKNTNTYNINKNVIGAEVEYTTGTVYNGFSKGNVTVNFADSVTEFFGLKRLTISEITLVGGDVQYREENGVVTPNVLINGVAPDETYEVTYGANNVDGEKSGSVKIKALPTNVKHFGEVEIKFDIATLSDLTLYSVIYTGSPQIPEVPESYECDEWYYKALTETEFSILDTDTNNFINAGSYKASAKHVESNATITVFYDILKRDNDGEISFVNTNDENVSSASITLGGSQFINVKGGNDVTKITYTINGSEHDFTGSLYKADTVGTVVFNATNGDGVNVDKLETSFTLNVTAPSALMLTGKVYDGTTCERDIDFTLYNQIGEWQYKEYGSDGYYALDTTANPFVDAGYYRLELQPNGANSTIFASFTIAKATQPEFYFIDSDNNKISDVVVKYGDTLSLRTQGGVLGAEVSLEVTKLSVTAPVTTDYVVTSTDALLFVAKKAPTKNYNEAIATLDVSVEKISLNDNAKIYYNGEEKYEINLPFDYQEKSVALTIKAIVGGEEVALAENDYELVWVGNRLEAGAHTATFIGKGNFVGEKVFTLNVDRISPRDFLDSSYTFEVGSTESVVNSVLPSGWYVVDTNFASKINSIEWTSMSVAFDINSVDYPSSHLGYNAGEEEYIASAINYTLIGGATIKFVHADSLEIINTTIGGVVNLDDYVSTKQGYEFGGWEYKGAMVDGEFTIKNKEVELIAIWTASDNTPYKIVHYVENFDGSYKNYAESRFEGTTGEIISVSADKIMNITGFTFDNFVNENTISSGVIVADGSLELALYYTRNVYNFSFSVGDDTEAVGETITFTKKYQETFDMPNSESFSKPGHNLVAWTRGNAIFNVGESYEVSASEIGVTLEFVAKFELKEISYTILHYCEEEIIRTEQLVAKFGEEVVATAGVEGYIFDAENEENITTGIVDETGLILKLYYTAIAFEINIINDGETPITINKNYGDKFVLPAPSADKGGYKFGGWMINGEIYKTGKEIEIYENIEITPVWHKFTEIPGVNGVEEPSEEQVEPIELTGSTIGIIAGVCGGVVLIAIAIGLYNRARRKRL